MAHHGMLDDTVMMNNSPSPLEILQAGESAVSVTIDFRGKGLTMLQPNNKYDRINSRHLQVGQSNQILASCKRLKLSTVHCQVLGSCDWLCQGMRTATAAPASMLPHRNERPQYEIQKRPDEKGTGHCAKLL